jgi:voltage-gated potassium channel
MNETAHPPPTGSADTDPGGFLRRLFAGFETVERPVVVIGLIAVLAGTLPDISTATDRLLTFVCVLVALVYAGLYVFRLQKASDRRMFALSGIAIIDLLAAAPVPLALMVGTESETARLFGILWALKLIRLNPAFTLLGRVLRNERQPLLSVALTFVVLTLFAATLAYLFERHLQPEEFSSLPAALWWTVVTVTTTGYGDKAPVSLAGRILAGGVMVSGIGLFALWAGILAGGFAQELRRREFLESWDLVVRLPLFRSLGASALNDIARLLKVQTCPARTVIVRKGQPGDSMFFIAEGEVEIRSGDERFRLQAGQFFGEKALITGESRSSTVVAVSRSRLLRLDVVDFRGLASDHPDLLLTIEAEHQRRTSTA